MITKMRVMFKISYGFLTIVPLFWVWSPIFGYPIKESWILNLRERDINIYHTWYNNLSYETQLYDHQTLNLSILNN